MSRRCLKRLMKRRTCQAFFQRRICSFLYQKLWVLSCFGTRPSDELDLFRPFRYHNGAKTDVCRRCELAESGRPPGLCIDDEFSVTDTIGVVSRNGPNTGNIYEDVNDESDEIAIRVDFCHLQFSITLSTLDMSKEAFVINPQYSGRSCMVSAIPIVVTS